MGTFIRKNGPQEVRQEVPRQEVGEEVRRKGQEGQEAPRSLRLQRVHEEGTREAEEEPPQARPQGPLQDGRWQLEQEQEVSATPSLLPNDSSTWLRQRKALTCHGVVQV